MSTIDEIFATISEEDLATSVDELLVIDPTTRQISLPSSELIFGVESDAHSERKYFHCSRYVGDNVDLASCFIRVNYRNANGEIDSHLVEDVTIKGDSVVFSWELHEKVTLYRGQVQFLVCAYRADKVEWNTTVSSGVVLEGIEPDVDGAVAETGDLVAQLLTMVAAQTEAVKAEGATQIAEVKASAKATETEILNEIQAKGTNTLASIPNNYTALGEAVGALERMAAPGIVCEAEGTSIVVDDASNRPVQNLRIFGRSTQDGTPTPDNPVEIQSVENPTISVNEQTLQTTHTLHGIPVASGGNYTDSNGQQWICDEVDFERGVYVQRVGRLQIDGEAKWSTYTYQTQHYGFILWNTLDESHTRSRGLCNQFANVGSGSDECFWVGVANKNIYAITKEWYDRGIDAWKEHLSENPLEIVYIRNTPIETPLTEAEIASFKTLHTNKPHTTVLNDQSAHTEISYVADTKLYIDRKIEAILG